VRVIAFHDVDDAEWFEDIITLLSRDFTLITPGAYEAGNFDLNKINIVISFDDGYASWTEMCVPILERHGVKALFFVNSGLLTVAHDTELTNTYVKNNLKLSPKRLLTWEGLGTLIKSGNTLGGHTVNHMSLRGVHEDVIKSEVEDDKIAIQSKCGIILKHFAYPFGAARDYSEKTETLIHGYGYTYVYIAEPGFVISGRKHIPRTLIEKHQSYRDIHRWMLGSYDLFTYLKRSIGGLRKRSDSD
jgi:peptidoglycan/xylan/chitin deacetylase (PgdA/CDA1 family)